MTLEEVKPLVEKMENVKEFCEELKAVMSKSEAESVFKKYGFDVELDEVEEGELSEESLLSVVGGAKCAWYRIDHHLHNFLNYLSGGAMGKHC